MIKEIIWPLCAFSCWEQISCSVVEAESLPLMLHFATVATRTSRGLLLAKYDRESSQRRAAGCDVIRPPRGGAVHVVSLYDLYLTLLFFMDDCAYTKATFSLCQALMEIRGPFSLLDYQPKNPSSSCLGSRIISSGTAFWGSSPSKSTRLSCSAIGISTL